MISDLSYPRELESLVAGGRVVVLTGAGVSTDSGIPDYRDHNGDWKRKRPVEFRDFLNSEHTRKRYWARSLIGWPHLTRAEPNSAHRGIYELEARQLLSLVITQNVDGLHQRAGSQSVLDLHGRIDTVVCLGCGRRSARSELQTTLAELNPLVAERGARVAPDGDADLEDSDTNGFRVVACAACGGMLKPDVVFFGENVPKVRVERAYQALATARLLLIIGSSLMVFSGYRFARQAVKNGVPIVIINQGKTRADNDALYKIEGNAGETLARLLDALAPHHS